MTLKITTPAGSYIDAVKFSMDYPNATAQNYQLILTSRYSQDILYSNSLTVVETNDRYTTFAFDYTDELGDMDISGLWDYQLDENFTAVERNVLKLINNKTKSLENKDKYVSPNENGDSYVIYE